jgi:hypothetical protein
MATDSCVEARRSSNDRPNPVQPLNVRLGLPAAAPLENRMAKPEVLPSADQPRRSPFSAKSARHRWARRDSVGA